MDIPFGVSPLENDPYEMYRPAVTLVNGVPFWKGTVAGKSE